MTTEDLVGRPQNQDTVLNQGCLRGLAVGGGRGALVLALAAVVLDR